ncbi:hypothetical protein B9Z19DRAFT_1134330 [Tuber borchii]|uniref:Uncharacterized protein n=1 Tax=Tuber borchii TaxID=42251 RepID=A0A2T6ZEC4_TUBBO|nr:hypothetical protein B9Z19DRAFT_1134330 [Tuber borchii]
MEYGSMTGASSGALIRPFGGHIRHSESFGLTVEAFRLESEAYKRSVRHQLDNETGSMPRVVLFSPDQLL